MSNPLSDVRAAIADALTAAGLQAYKTVPDRAVPPLVYVAPGNPYVSYEGATFNGQIVRCYLVPIAARGTNDVNAEQLDELVLQVLDAVRAAPELAEFTLGDVGQPGQVPINGQSHLGVDIEIQTEIHRPRS